MPHERTELRKTLPGDAKVKVNFSTPNESWEVDLNFTSRLHWDNGTQPDAVGLDAEFTDEDEDEDE